MVKCMIGLGYRKVRDQYRIPFVKGTLESRFRRLKLLLRKTGQQANDDRCVKADDRHGPWPRQSLSGYLPTGETYLRRTFSPRRARTSRDRGPSKSRPS